MAKTEPMPLNRSNQPTSKAKRPAVSRILTAGLLSTALLAFVMSGTIDRINAWNIVALLAGSNGMFLLLRDYLPLAWIGASLPFWILAGAWPWLMYAALGLVFVGLGTTLALPYLARKRSIDAIPATCMANGPLVAVPERTFHFRTGKRMLMLTMAFSGVLLLAGCILLVIRMQDGGWTLLIVGTVLGLSFAVSFWINSRGRYRINPSGVYGRAFLWETFIPWTQVCSLFLRYQFMPGLGQRWVYYCVRAPGKVIAFPHTLAGADELREFIEKATGMTWPAGD